MRADIQPGARFPDYELPDHNGEPRRLSELQGQTPMILILSRGSYDPKEHWFMHQIAGFYPQLKVGLTRLVTISTDDRLNTNEFRDQLGAEWPFLSDPDRVIARDLEIEEYTDPI